MDCKKTCERLSVYIDNELTEQEKTALDGHLAGCAECREELMAMRAAGEAVKAVPEVTLSPDFRARFWQKVRESVPIRTVWERVTLRCIPVPVALAALVVIFSGFSVFSPLVYGIQDTALKSDAVRLAARTVTAGANSKVFAPLNFVDFCDRCTRMLCTDCREGSCTEKQCCCGGEHQ